MGDRPRRDYGDRGGYRDGPAGGGGFGGGGSFGQSSGFGRGAPDKVSSFGVTWWQIGEGG